MGYRMALYDLYKPKPPSDKGAKVAALRGSNPRHKAASAAVENITGGAAVLPKLLFKISFIFYLRFIVWE